MPENPLEDNTQRVNSPQTVEELRCNIRFEGWPLSKRLPYLDNIYLEHPRISQLLKRLDECHESYGLGTPRCGFIYGRPGVGKTCLYRHYVGAVRPVETPEGTEYPILCIPIPARATIRSTAASILYHLHDPQWDKGTADILSIRVQGLMQECNVRLLVLDEFHHLIDRKTQRIVVETSEWLKTLIEATKVPVVAFGMPSALDVLRYNEQLSRRFKVREEFRPFSLDTTADAELFMGFLHAVDLRLPLAQRSHLYRPEVVRAIWKATEGVTQYVMDIIRDAAIEAVRCGRERIVWADLAFAFEQNKAMFSFKGPKNNPFV